MLIISPPRGYEAEAEKDSRLFQKRREHLRHPLQSFLTIALHAQFHARLELLAQEGGRERVQRRLDRGDLDENFVGAAALDQHPSYGSDVAFEAGETVAQRLLCGIVEILVWVFYGFRLTHAAI